MTTTLPTTYRETDSSPIEMEMAVEQWAVIARQELERVARSYGEVVQYSELADAVQTSTGIRTRKLMRHWIGNVLSNVGADCHARGEPLLSSLCVQKDGTIGDGYGVALVNIYGGDAPDDLDQQTGAEGPRCYQQFGAGMPADRRRAQPPPQETAPPPHGAEPAEEGA